MAEISGLSWTGVIRQAAVLGGLWLILTGADPGSLVVGVPAVLFAALVSDFRGRGTSIRIVPLLRFLPVFLLRSVVAAFDVARRTLAAGLPISPGLVSHDLTLPPGASRVVFMNTVSLLPGTLSATLKGDRLTVHVLDDGRDHPAELAALEKTMAGIFPGASRD
ncbi:Na+/H+ antiporter subunit E [Chromatocurvus halotolerans]|uniref:Multicomponent Na+:H+ antiporter subunit E n=1 Tax=Chromatocurvus halotolerans TaxID=1132028 RepID=A0A4R2L307_9GAMM|nr:Na+/H+ antiporter subunit E [Chromatocurvus halotolerans]TCO78299.1 multicomponent Na+:H+ antiporter subunit E [Chromatocurvus halotolerans]